MTKTDLSIKKDFTWIDFTWMGLYLDGLKRTLLGWTLNVLESILYTLCDLKSENDFSDRIYSSSSSIILVLVVVV